MSFDYFFVFWRVVFLIFEVIRLFSLIVYHIFQNASSRWFPPEKKKVMGKVVVITGGGHGIGKELCKQFVGLGAKVVVIDNNSEHLKLLKSEISLMNGAELLLINSNVCSEESMTKAAERILNTFKTVDILINNAGISYFTPFANLNSTLLEKIFKVNVISHFLTTKAFLPIMQKHKSGHIVAMASLGGWTGMTNLTDYCSTKSAILGFMDALRQELEDNGKCYIKLTTISPYFVNTGMWEKVSSRIFPILNAEQTAMQSIDGILREKFYVFVPGYMEYMISLAWFLPVTCRSLLCEFLGIKVKPNGL